MSSALLFTLLNRYAGGGGGTPPEAGPIRWAVNSSGWTVPQADEDVYIGPGVHVVFDGTSNSVRDITVAEGGTFEVSSTADGWLKCRSFTLEGTYKSGSSSTPNNRNFRRTMIGPAISTRVKGLSHSGNTPTAGYPGDSGGIRRGFLAMEGSSTQIYTAVPPITTTKLAAHALSGTTTLHLQDPVTWKQGDEVMITRTDFYSDTLRTMIRTLAADVNDSTTITLTTGIQEDLFGLVQYYADDKILRTTPGHAFTLKSAGGMRPSMAVRATLDERAVVINMTRKHLIEGDNDGSWTTDRLGCHDMFMGHTTTSVVKGVQYKRCGQGGIQGRYPIHAHANQIVPNTASRWPDFAPGQFAWEDISIMDSANRAVTLHACCGVEVRRMAAWKVAGHAAFFEEASELRNLIEDSDFHYMYDPGPGWRIKKHDEFPGGIWATNPYNYIRRNRFSDTPGNPIIIAINDNRDPGNGPGGGGTKGCWGLSSNQLIQPGYYPVLEWLECEGHTGGLEGRETGYAGTIDEEGNQAQFQPRPRTDFVFPAADTADSDNRNFIIDGDFYWKNNGGGLHHSVYNPRYHRIIVADNKYFDFHGRTQFGLFEDTTFVQQSLNVTSDPGQRYGLVSYHGTAQPRRSMVWGYETDLAPVPAGHETRDHLWMNSWMGGFDNYLQAVYFFGRGMTGTTSTHQCLMYQTPPPSMQEFPPFDVFSHGVPSNRLASMMTAFYDPEGEMFGTGPDRFMLIDHPAITYNCADLIPIEPRGVWIGMTSTSSRQQSWCIDRGQIWVDGVIPLFPTGESIYALAMTFQHVDSSGADVPAAKWQIPSVFDRRPGVDSISGVSLFCSFADRSRFRLYNHDTPSQRWTRIKFMVQVGWNDETAWEIVGIPWNSGAPSRVCIGGPTINFAAGNGVASWAALNAATSTKWWNDTATQTLWVKVYPFAVWLGPLNDFDNGQVYFTAIRNWEFPVEIEA